MSVNKVILVGNVGGTPEIKSTQDGKKFATFSVATSESWKDKITGEKKDQTEWHRVVVFAERTAEVVEKYVKKGSKLYIEGSIKTRKWTDKDGVERYTTEVVLQNFNSRLDLLDSKGDSSSSGEGDYGSGYNNNKSESNNASASNKSDYDDIDDEIPF